MPNFKGLLSLQLSSPQDRNESVIAAAVTTNSEHWGSAEVLELDLADLSSVRRFAALWIRRGQPLHLLVNSAGTMQGCNGTVDQHEHAFQVKHMKPT